MGAVQVRLTEERKPLWLIVLKERGKGYCWLLFHLDCDTKEEATELAFVGYGHRWKIEEVHGQIKDGECTTVGCGFIAVYEVGEPKQGGFFPCGVSPCQPHGIWFIIPQG